MSTVAEDIMTLFSDNSTLCTLTMAAKNLIATYNLPFDADDTIKAFDQLSKTNGPFWLYYLTRLLLDTNLRMFIAVMYALLDNKRIIWQEYLITFTPPFKLGYSNSPTESIKQFYCMLHDYYSFDITDLILPDELREQIQNHIGSKGRYTKRAVKQP